VQALGEAGVRGFSRPGVESSSLYDNTVGAVFPQPAEFLECIWDALYSVVTIPQKKILFGSHFGSLRY